MELRLRNPEPCETANPVEQTEEAMLRDLFAEMEPNVFQESERSNFRLVKYSSK
jgi:hypothetical protein